MKEFLLFAQKEQKKIEITASLLLLATAFFGAFSLEQKNFIKQRDREHGIQYNKGGCQFPQKHFCNGDRQVQVHHIIPQRWSKDLDMNPDYVENGITLCEYSHQNLVHPDMLEAKRGYGKDKNSYKKVFEKREVLLQSGQKYWVDRWDEFFKQMAEHTTRKMNKKAS